MIAKLPGVLVLRLICAPPSHVLLYVFASDSLYRRQLWRADVKRRYSIILFEKMDSAGRQTSQSTWIHSRFSILHGHRDKSSYFASFLRYIMEAADISAAARRRAPNSERHCELLPCSRSRPRHEPLAISALTCLFAQRRNLISRSHIDRRVSS